MVKVNLLSPESGKPKDTIFLKFTLDSIPGLLIILILIITFFGLSLRLITLFQEKSLTDTIQEYKKAEALAKKVNELKEEDARINKEIKFLDVYLERRVLWSLQLSELGKLIPKEIWLNSLLFERKKLAKVDTYVLTLKGGLIPQEKQSHIGTLSHFVGLFKSNKTFAENFGNPILSDLRSETKDKIETMGFTLELPYRKKL